MPKLLSHGWTRNPPLPRTARSVHRVIAWADPWHFVRAAAVPDRVGAVASFHGGGLVTDQPNSPHLEAAKSKAQFLVAIAANDDASSPKDKDVMKDTFAKAGLPAEIEVYEGCRAWLVSAGFARLQRAAS